MTPFGVKIRQLRKDRGISQKQMAQDMELSPAYLSALEHGHRGRPSWAMIQQIISYFNLIWDDAEEIEELARLSHPKITIDTSGLSAEAVELVNRLSLNIREFPQDKILEILKIIEREQ